MNTNTIWFDAIRKDDVSLVGGKAANLGELVSAGIPVPPGYAVTADAYRDFIRQAGLQERIDAILGELDVEDSSALDNASERIKKAILQTPMKLSLMADIKSAYGQIGDGLSLVAVRSSATSEDLEDASSAGQQATFLNVSGADDVVRAVQACWASLFEPRAIFYRVQKGQDHSQVEIAVVVQQMVQSAKAGVMFTSNASNGNPDQIQIDAAYGLGEAVVGSEVTPDCYLVVKSTGAIVDKQVVPQSKMLVRNPDHAGGHDDANIWKLVPGFLSDAPKLTEEQIIMLAEIAKKVEAHYGGPQDMEWAIDDYGEIWLTQARSLTAHLQDYLLDVPLAEEEEPAAMILKGTSTGPGVATGHVRVLNGPHEISLIQQGDVLVAKMTTPDYVPAMQKATAIVTEEGGATCHAAIVARELGVPCIVGAHGALETLGSMEGQTITVDASHGEVFEGVAETRLAWNARREEALLELKKEMASTKTDTKVMVILADPALAPSVAAMNVDGVGLLRLEFILNRIGTHPRQFMAEGRSEDYIKQIYDGVSAIAGPFGERDVILRLMDFKTNELKELKGGEDFEADEDNPMLGLRGAIRYLQQPDVFALELEAIRRVREVHKNLHVMVPFVRTPDELRRTQELMAEHGLVRGKDGLKVWMMAEVPSNVFLLDEFMGVGLDGLSIGSNDLTQMILGRDRDNPRLGELDERDPAVMKAIEMIVTGGRARGLTVGICGQAPSNFPELTRKLVEWGVTSISVSEDAVNSTRKIVSDVEAALKK